ncbi:hypothetical protein ACJIZ3_004613 [Penstemon smallii]|uniref:Uncharacterized protein n=1 Tax=Penstemon smallii TaxID=265156 RepID=A0ABD3S2I3_9LAMI
MKLSGWMLSKFLENNNEAQKDFSIGQPSMEDLQCYPKGSYCSKENNLGNSFTSVKTARIKEEYLEEDEMNVINDELGKVKGASSRYESCNGAIFIYPLLSCLLGSTIELQETALPVKSGNRISLGELFQKAKLIEDKSDKCSIHLMKSKNSTTIDSATTDSKTHEVRTLDISFDRKNVHILH